ncbi:MAG TPA: hypothetical protein DCW29_21630 [Janthinobacterium sp.]|nr:hypothetical protein [Janthinobacterium sp.]
MKLKLHRLGVLAASLALFCAGQANAGQNTFVVLDSLGGDYSSAEAINNAGQVTGSSSAVDNPFPHAVLWSGGQTHDLGTLSGGTNSVGVAINSAGHVVGSSDTSSNGELYATVWKDGTATRLAGGA